MAYDYYHAAEELAARLDFEGRSDLGGKIRQVLTEGFSSTEILMGLKFTLSHKEYGNVALSPMASEMRVQLLAKLRTHIRP